MLYVACWLPPGLAADLAVPGGEPADSLHMTLCCIGDLEQLPGDAADTANAVLTRWAQTTAPIDGQVSGVGRFIGPDGDCIYLSVDAPDLAQHRQRLWALLDAAGLTPDRTHGFTPHVTVAYVPRAAAAPNTIDALQLPQPVRFATVTLCSPGMPPRAGIPLRGDTPDVVSLRKRVYPTLVRAHVRGTTLDPAVLAEVRSYFNQHPDIRASEAAEHGCDPVADIPRYLAAEFTEPEHATLRTGQPLTVSEIKQWERQETAEPREVAKDALTAGEVHVDTASGAIAVSYDPLTGKKKRRRRDVGVVKADDEQRVVYGVVLEPNVEDSQGDVISKEDIELAAHRFLYGHAAIGDQHRRLAPSTVRPVESYIAPCDFELGGQTVRKGSWVLATHVPDDQLWEQVKKGGKGAYSVAGSGKRTGLD